MSATLKPRELPDWLLGRGQHFVTDDEIAALLDIKPGSASDSLKRARESKRIISVTKGGWVPVPPEYRAAGAPPPLHYVDAMMRHLGHPYYIGFLSAAALHGAAHQAPMVVQVVTPVLLRDRVIGQGRLQFIRRAQTTERSTQTLNVPTGRITVSTPEVTVLDLMEAPRLGAGLSNIATIIGDLLLEQRLDSAKLAFETADYPTSVVRRTGFLVELMANALAVGIDLGPLAERVGEGEYTLLDTASPRSGEAQPRWRVVANTEVEHDL